MTFPGLQLLFLRCLGASLLFISLVSCSGAKYENLLDDVFLDREKRLEVVVPEAFTADSARQLGSKVDSIFRYLHKKKGFNGTVLVTKYDQVICKGAYGYADFPRKDTLTTQTPFQLASVSKQFTAMAIMMLQERGKLAYDDSVQQYLEDFPYKGMTIRHLLTHRSGLPDYTYFSDKLWPDRKKGITNRDVLHLMKEHQPSVYFKPDRRFNYSNTGYLLLAAIVEEVSGMPFADFLQEKIFEPLQMTSTFTFNPEAVAEPGKCATGYISGRRKRTPDYLDTVLGDKGMFSTIEDLYKWDQALYTQKLVKWQTLEEAFAGAGTVTKKTEDYGFGWRIRQVESGDTVVYHGGLWHGYNTYLLRNPKDHSAIIVLSNVTNGSLNYLKEVRQLLYPEQPGTEVKNSRKAKLASVR